MFRQFFVCLLLLCGFNGSVVAVDKAQTQSAIGHVIFAKGDVRVNRDSGESSLGKGSAIQRGDEIMTGEDGFVEVKMADGARIRLRPKSRFRFKRFRLGKPRQPGKAKANANATKQTTASKQRTGVSINELIAGQVRTITGAVGKSKGDQYRLETPVATIGVRGTHYQVQYCQAGGCDRADGLHVKVHEGRIVVKTTAGELQFGAGEQGFVGRANSLPRHTGGKAGQRGQRRQGQSGPQRHRQPPPAPNANQLPPAQRDERTNFPDDSGGSVSANSKDSQVVSEPQATSEQQLGTQQTQLVTEEAAFEQAVPNTQQQDLSVQAVPVMEEVAEPAILTNNDSLP